jgi:hypothetical protein
MGILRKKIHLAYSGILFAFLLTTSFSCRSTETRSVQFESKPRNVLVNVGISSSSDPKLAVSSSGTVALLSVYGEENPQLGLFVSHNGGDAFTSPLPVSEPGKHVHSHGENSPSLIYRPTETYVLWEQMGEAGSELVFARSINFGQSFEKPVRVTDKATPSFNGFSAMGVAPDGTVYVIWLDGRDQQEIPGTFSLYMARSTDRGGTFGKNQKIAGGVCPCCRASIAFDSGKDVYIAWRKVFPPDIRDIVVSASQDGGSTFAEPVRVSVDNWKLNGCPHSGPSIIVPNGNKLYVTWQTEGTTVRPGVMLASSEDQGKTFSHAQHISGEILDANHPVLTASEDGRVAVVFQGRPAKNSNGWSPAQTIIVPLSNNGRLLPYEIVPGNNKPVSYPAIAAGTAGRLFVAWTESDEKGRDVALCRGRIKM